MTWQASGRPHETLYWRMRNKAALRHGDWKIVKNPSRRGQSSYEFELYNLKEDLGETRNLSRDQPEKLRELSRIWTTLDRQMIPPGLATGPVTLPTLKSGRRNHE